MIHNTMLPPPRPCETCGAPTLRWCSRCLAPHCGPACFRGHEGCLEQTRALRVLGRDTRAELEAALWCWRPRLVQLYTLAGLAHHPYDAVFLRGKIALHAAFPDDARFFLSVDEMKNAEGMERDFEALLYEAALAHVRRRDYASALKALDRSPPTPYIEAVRVGVYIAQAKFVRAQKTLDKITWPEGDCKLRAQLLDCAGDICAWKGDYAGAAAHYRARLGCLKAAYGPRHGIVRGETEVTEQLCQMWVFNGWLAP